LICAIVCLLRPAVAVLSGDLKLNHTGEKLALKGGLIVDDAQVSIDKLPRAGRPTLDVKFSDPREDEEKPVRTATELDVKITSPSRIALRGRGVNASMSLEAHVTGAFNDPVLAGEAGITRGRFNFLGKRFALNDSKVIFNDDIMESRLENALGLDTLDFGQSATGQTQLTTGKYLSDNVYVEVRGSAEGTPGIAVEWTPRKNISVEAETRRDRRADKTCGSFGQKARQPILDPRDTISIRARRHYRPHTWHRRYAELDIFDMGWKCNNKNAALLRAAMEKRHRERG